jgi:hypothetical protein
VIYSVRINFLNSSLESALNELRNFGQYFLLNNIKAAEPPDAAYAIIRGGALRAVGFELGNISGDKN